MKYALLAVLLAACGSDADPHAPATCVDWTNNDGTPWTGTCELACDMPPPTAGDTCDTVVQLNCRAFEFEGVRGCCIPDDTTIKFVECA